MAACWFLRTAFANRFLQIMKRVSLKQNRSWMLIADLNVPSSRSSFKLTSTQQSLVFGVELYTSGRMVYRCRHHFLFFLKQAKPFARKTIVASSSYCEWHFTALKTLRSSDSSSFISKSVAKRHPDVTQVVALKAFLMTSFLARDETRKKKKEREDSNE